MAKQMIKVKINGRDREGAVEPRVLLVHFIRESANLTGTHIGCDTSHCGACTVMLNGKTVKSCTMFAVQADGGEITTVEGLMNGDQFHPLQEGFKQEHGLQCGFCTPGMLMSSLRAAAEEPESYGRRYTLGNFRQSMPLHRISEHCEGRAVCRQEDERGEPKQWRREASNVQDNS